MTDINTPMDWNHPAASSYEQTISLKIPGYLLLYDMMDRLLTAQLAEAPAAPSFLIIGAGGGQELVTLGARHESWTFTGVDPAEPMIVAAKRRMEQAGLQERVTLIHGEIDRLPANERFDAATCLLVLHFIKGTEQKKRLLHRIAEHLNDGAPLFVAAINGRVGTASFTIQMQAWKSHMLANGISLEDWNRFERSMGVESDPIPVCELEDMLKELGFEQITRFYGAYLIDGLFAIKRGNVVQP
jgi:tRNA (cmo5U34)-methyltransferase